MAMIDLPMLLSGNSREVVLRNIYRMRRRGWPSVGNGADAELLAFQRLGLSGASN